MNQADKLIDALLPCPFCGSQPDVHKTSVYIACINKACEIRPVAKYYHTIEQAAKDWNIRKQPEPQLLFCEPVCEISYNSAKAALDALQTPKEQPVKDEAYYRRVYNECSEGEFYPFRDHETNFGWGICHRKTKRIFGYIGEKSKCFGVSAALNGKWEAAKEFLEGDIPDEYFEQFKLLGD